MLFFMPNISTRIIVVGASKKQGVGSIKSALIAGVNNFGENFLQESEPKIMELDSGLSWHFIGSIQSRKAKKISSHGRWQFERKKN